MKGRMKGSVARVRRTEGLISQALSHTGTESSESYPKGVEKPLRV